MIVLALLVAALQPDYHGDASLVSSMSAVRSGQTFEVAVRIRMNPGWHTYWVNPGDAGIPPKITWKLPRGWKVGSIQWPVPHKLISPDVVSYGYEHEVLLLTQLRAPTDSVPGTTDLQAHVDWLVCQEGCIPAKADVSLPIKIGRTSLPNPVWGRKIADAVRDLPLPAPSNSFEAVTSDRSVLLMLPAKECGNGNKIYFMSSEPLIDPSAPQPVDLAGQQARLHLSFSQFLASPAKRLRGLLFTAKGDKVTAQSLDIPIRRNNS